MNAGGNRQGRWLTPDPLGGDITNPQSLNRYAYALNNPETNTDPSGLGPPCSRQQQCASYGQNYATYQWWSSIWGGGAREFDYAFYPGYESEGEFVPGGIDPSGSALAGAGLFGPFGGGHQTGLSVILDTPESLFPLEPVSNQGCSVQASAFVSANAAYADQIAQVTGVPATSLLGLSALESNFGTSNLATNYNNYFGLTVGSAFKGTTGVYTTPDGRNFGVYPSPGFLTSGLSFAQSFQGHRVSGVTDPAAFASRLTTPPLAFNSEPGYAAKLLSRIGEMSPCQ